MYRHPAGPRRLHRLGPGVEPGRYERFTLRPLGTTLAAEVRGLAVGPRHDDEAQRELEAALAEWKVLVWRDQDVPGPDLARFAARFGTVTDDHLIQRTAPDPVDNLVVFTRDADTVGLENQWHSDGTFRVVPTKATVLQALEVPEVGGDTIYVDMAAAYDNLDADVRARIDGLRAVHDWSIGAYADKYGDALDDHRRRVPPVVQPLVLRHPVTGRRTLWVNRTFTARILGLPADEGDALLDLLCRQAEIPEYQYRVHWEPGTVVLWDNLAVQHYGVNDYWPQRRVMARATVAGTWELGEVLAPDAVTS